MTDEEKLKGFKLCADGKPCIGNKYVSCPFSPRNNAEQNCGVTMAKYALALLEEQQDRIETLESLRTIEQEWR